MNSRQLEYVVAVSRTLSFSEAAKELYVSQPSLSQYIKKVEKEIGAELFIRTTPLKLTYEGEIFVRYAKNVLEEERNLDLAMHDISNDQIGKITIGAGPLNSTMVLPIIFEKYLQAFPKIQLSIAEMPEEELLNMLDEGTTDIILTVMSPTLNEPYVIEEVHREQYVLVIPKELDKQGQVTPSGLHNDLHNLSEIKISNCKDLPYILQTQAMPAHILFENLCRKEGFVPQARVTCRNINTAIHMARRGIGACIVPSSILDKLGDRFNCYLLEGNTSERVIKIIYRRSMKLTSLQSALIQEIHNYYEKSI